MKKIKRTRKRILNKYRYIRFRDALIERLSAELNAMIDEAILYGWSKDPDEEWKHHFVKGVDGAWQEVNGN